ncbi:transposase (plasmid) [Rhizobium favelukesii]|uniref:Transposase n=1 Tax=Rhizobium favelukesii TaxID=348824 RepID=W6RHE3_9HYPH|nr:transposase [Rhizobium favelukesii]
MRGGDVRTGQLFSYVDLEDRVRKDHPLRAIRRIVNDALVSLEGEFAALYSPIGRPSIAPEKLLRAMLLQAFYSIRSERLLMERLEYDLLFRWFVDIGIDDPAWDHSVFSKNRDRLLKGDIAAKFLGAILSVPQSGSSPAMQRQALPEDACQTLTALIVRLLVNHANGESASQQSEAGYDACESGHTTWNARPSCMSASPRPVTLCTIAKAASCNMRCAAG